MFATRIETTAESLGYRVEWIETARQVSSLAMPEPADGQLEFVDRQPAEHMFGPGADLVEMVTALRPALMIFDLGNPNVPWPEWIALLKSAPATRRYPLLAYGAHVDAAALAEARKRGADSALARSRFTADLPELIQKYARLPDLEALRQACAGALSARALEGLELFNHGEYFEAHELLETAWNEDPSAGRELYRAILQVAVAYLQIERGNYNGAVKMFLRVRQWIEPLPDECRGVDVARLRQDAANVRRRLTELGRERIAEFDRSLFRPVIYR
jgi:predicted metal-dependent hydrolase